MEDQRVLHYFISTVNNFQQCSAPAQVVPVVAPQEEEVIEATEAFVDPNQITIFDVIAEEEAKEAEATQITYTDPAGNTFESIDFHNEVVNNYTEDPEDEEDLNDWMNLPLEADEDDAPTYTPDESQEYTGENASYMSIEENAKEYAEDAVRAANFDDLIFNINDDEDNDSSDFF
jgi:uncharacterized membrane protein YdfJ with MMPL/SSD domain